MNIVHGKGFEHLFFTKLEKKGLLTLDHRAAGGLLTKDTNPQQKNILIFGFKRHNLLHENKSFDDILHGEGDLDFFTGKKFDFISIDLNSFLIRTVKQVL
jgi:hypothetical protein